MGVYQVIFEECKEDGTCTNIEQFIEAKDLLSVAKNSHFQAEQMDWELKSVRYVLTIVGRIAADGAAKEG